MHKKRVGTGFILLENAHVPFMKLLISLHKIKNFQRMLVSAPYLFKYHPEFYWINVYQRNDPTVRSLSKSRLESECFEMFFYSTAEPLTEEKSMLSY